MIAHRPKQTLQKQSMLESAHKGYAYEVLELEIAIEEDTVSNSKIQSITRLIQLYMIGVEVLEGAEDQRYKFFNKKLQSLMLKKPVAEQLKFASLNRAQEVKHPMKQSEKRQQHEVQMMYNQDMHDTRRVRQIVRNVEERLKNYEGLVSKHINKQQQGIKQRIQLRKLKSDSGFLSFNQGSVVKFDISQQQHIESRVFDTPPESSQTRLKNFVTTTRHDAL